jgi:hypothetical protein
MQAETLFKKPLAFTQPPLCLTHTGIRNTLGHEMTHTISFFAAKPIKKTALISEGVCVYFDLAKRDNLNQLKTINQSDYSVIDIWTGKVRVDDKVIYPLGRRTCQKIGRNLWEREIYKITIRPVL